MQFRFCTPFFRKKKLYSYLIGPSRHLIVYACDPPGRPDDICLEWRFLAHFFAEFMTFRWCLWRAHWFLWNSLELVCRNISGKQAICIHIAEAKRETFSADSPNDIEARWVIPQICRGMKIWSRCKCYAYQVCMRTVRVAEFALKMNMQLRLGLIRLCCP